MVGSIEEQENQRDSEQNALPSCSSEEMCKTIPVSELRVGMQVIDPPIDWVKRPFLFGSDVFIDSEDAIKRIIDQGYREVTIDLARTSDVLFIKELPHNPTFFQSKGTPPGPKVSLEEELPKAVKVHDECVAYARRFMTDMSTGKMNLTSASDMVESIMSSIERNADALISLSRLHRTDAYTYMHCVNVSILTTCFSRYLDEGPDRIFSAGVSGLFHDLGKALVPLRILNAPRKLTETEFDVLRRHPELGHEQLSQVPGILPDVLLATLEHHEKLDGTGYPQRLSGDQISRIGSITAVADIYDALTSRRVYKGAMYPHKALGIMYQTRDKEFSADIIEQFIRMVGIYPVGSVVALEDGYMAVVSCGNPQRPTQPVVTIVQKPDGTPLRAWKVCDLALGQGSPISACLPPEKSSIDPRQILKLPN